MPDPHPRDLIGDGFSEASLTESGVADQGVKGRHLAAEGMFEYGSRVGFWRVMRTFHERGLPLTVFGCGLALERHSPRDLNGGQ